MHEDYYHSGEEVIAEYNGDGQLLRSYILGERLDIPVAVIEDTHEYYYVYDPQGSIIALTDTYGRFVEKYKYDSHGNFEILLDSPLVENRYFYNARDFEKEINLYHNRARFYDPVNGFFIQRDPLGYVDSSNPYIYTSGNSVNYSDPLGLSEKSTKSIHFAHEIKDKDGKIVDVQFQVKGKWYKIKKDGSYVKDKDGMYNFDPSNTVSIGPEDLPKVPTAAVRLKDFLDSNLDEATKNQLGVLAQIHGDKVAVDAMQASFDSGHTSFVDLFASQMKAQKDFYTNFAKTNPKTTVLLVALTLASMGHFKYKAPVGKNAVVVINSKESNELRKKLILFTNNAHVPGPSYIKGKGIQPADFDKAFEGAVKYGDNTWFAKSLDGKGIYRYAENQGMVHWNGSSQDLVKPLAGKALPAEIIEYFGFNVKGAKTPWK